MIKKLLFTLLQFVLFLFAFAVGPFLPIIAVLALHTLRSPSIITKWANGTRGFQWDGILLMLAFFAVVLLIEALRKRIRSAAPWTALALALATIAGLIMKFGFLSFDQQ